MPDFKQENLPGRKEDFMTETEVRELIAASLANWTGITRFRTIETSVITTSDFTESQHNHSNAAGGGKITTSAISGEIAVAQGGTGLATLTSGAYLKGAGTSDITFSTTPLSGTKTYFVADSSGGAVTRKLTIIDGILNSET